MTSAKVLILDTTVSGGASSVEAQAAVAAGLTVDVVDAAGWAAKTAAQFSDYRALILGDPTCTSSLANYAAADANKATWGPLVNGKVLINGTDPRFHDSQGGNSLSTNGVQFAASDPDKTGMYISLSCLYHDTAANTPVPLLDGFQSNGFTVTGVGCFNDAHIVATHPALAGITDATLSNWSCSVHEAFDKWPVSFQVLAIANNIGSSFTATDGSVGTPYILARGVDVISDISLAPPAAVKALNANHTLTATVTTDDSGPVPGPVGAPVIGSLVTFEVIGGPNIGLTGTDTTDSSGHATFTYSSSLAGTDFVVARFVDAQERTQTSNTATVQWGDGQQPEAINVTGKIRFFRSFRVSPDKTKVTYFLTLQNKTNKRIDGPITILFLNVDPRITIQGAKVLPKGNPFGVPGGTPYITYMQDVNGNSPAIPALSAHRPRRFQVVFALNSPLTFTDTFYNGYKIKVLSGAI